MIGVFFANGFEEVEALTVVDLLRRAGIDTRMVSVYPEKMVEGSHGIKVYADQTLAETDFDLLEGIVLPGGAPGFSNLEKCEPLMLEVDRFASEKKLVNVGRITSVCALVIAMIAVYPIMGGADQAFQIIQEYSGFVYPGVVVIFGLGLLWKRASGPAAVVAAIGTFFFSILFKFLMPNVPFLLRMGYVFLVLVAIFVPMSLLNKNGRIEAEKLDQHTIDTQLKWSKILFIAAGVSFAVFIWGVCDPVLRSWGFEAMLFFAAILGVLGLYLRSNAKDKYQNAKAVGIDLALFRTDRTFNIGAICVIVILAVLYIFLW